MAASDEDDSEFERFLQQSLSSSSASARSPRNNPSFQKLPSSVREQEEEEEEDGELAGLQWLKVPGNGAGGMNRGRGGGGRGRGGGRKGGEGPTKLELSVPSSQSMGGGEKERSETVTYSSDFSKDSIEVSSTSTSTQRPESAEKEFQDSFTTGLSNSSRLDQSHYLSGLNQSGVSSLTKRTAKEDESGETESETDKDQATPKKLSLSPSRLSVNPPTNQQIQSSSCSTQKMIAPPSEEAPVITTSNEPILHHHSPNTTAVVCVPELKAKGEGLSSQVGTTWNESDLRLATSGDRKPLTVTRDSLSSPLLQLHPRILTTKTNSSIIEEEGEGERGSERVGAFASLPLISIAESHKPTEEGKTSPTAQPEREEKAAVTNSLSLPRAASEPPVEVGDPDTHMQQLGSSVAEVEMKGCASGMETLGDRDCVQEDDKLSPSLPQASDGLIASSNQPQGTVTKANTKSFALGESVGQDLSPPVEPEKDERTDNKIVLFLTKTTSETTSNQNGEGSMATKMPALMESGEPGNERVKVFSTVSDVSSVGMDRAGKVREGGEEERQLVEEKGMREKEKEGEDEEGDKMARTSHSKQTTPQGEEGEDFQWREVVLQVAGEGLETELKELQGALEAAGLPGIAARTQLGISDRAGAGDISSATRDCSFQLESSVSKDRLKMSRELQSRQKSEFGSSVSGPGRNRDQVMPHKRNFFSEFEMSQNKEPDCSERAIDLTSPEGRRLAGGEKEVHQQHMFSVSEVGEKMQRKISGKTETGHLAARMEGDTDDYASDHEHMSVSGVFKKGGRREGEGRGEEDGGLEGAIRALAKEELSSITRELLFQRDSRRQHLDVGPSERRGVVRRRGLVAKGCNGHEVTQNETKTGTVTRKSGLATPKSGPFALKTGLSGSKTGSYKSGSAPTGLIGGLKPRLKGSKTSLSSSKQCLPTSVAGSVARLDRGADSKSTRGGRGGGERREERERRKSGREVEILKAEVKSLKQALIEQQARVQSEQEEREKEYRSREEAAEASHLQREAELQQKIATLTDTIESMDQVRSPRERVKVGGAISEREWEELRRSVAEQETIMLGYQKENEKLYSQLIEAQSALRSTREQLATDTQRLRTELANSKAKLDARTRDKAKPADSTGENTTSKSDDIIRITQLEERLERTRDELVRTQDQLERSEDRCRGLERQVTQLEHSLSVTQQQQLGEGEGKGRGEEGEREEQLREKEKEILELKEKLSASQRREKGMRKKMAGGADSQKRIQELERQVRGLNDVIRRRFPNSLSALILAATSTASSAEGQNHLQNHLEGREKKKEGDEDSGLKTRMREMGDEMRRKEEEMRSKEDKMREKMATIEEAHSAIEYDQKKQIASLMEELKKRRRVDDREMELSSRGGDERERTSPGGGGGGGGGVGGEDESGRKALIRENKALKQQLSAVKIEADHERLQLETRLAETEAQERALREDSNSLVSSLRRGHVTEVDSLKAQLARLQSHSEMASLRSKLSSLQVEHHLLQQRLEEGEEEREDLQAAREREKELSQQLQLLSEQLVESKRYHTPDMHHYSSLLAKISSLETRISNSEAAVRQRVERLRQPITHQIQQVERKWRRVVQAKDTEIAQFRSEMETILQTLHALQHNQPPSPSFVVH